MLTGSGARPWTGFRLESLVLSWRWEWGQPHVTIDFWDQVPQKKIVSSSEGEMGAGCHNWPIGDPCELEIGSPSRLKHSCAPTAWGWMAPTFLWAEAAPHPGHMVESAELKLDINPDVVSSAGTLVQCDTWTTVSGSPGGQAKAADVLDTHPEPTQKRLLPSRFLAWHA